MLLDDVVPLEALLIVDEEVPPLPSSPSCVSAPHAAVPHMATSNVQAAPTTGRGNG